MTWRATWQVNDQSTTAGPPVNGGGQWRLMAAVNGGQRRSTVEDHRRTTVDHRSTMVDSQSTGGGTTNMGLLYSKDTDMSLTAYSDAHHTGCQDARRSTSRSAQFLGDKLVNWSSKKQKSTAISST
ncbi:hypothetical protein Tco_1022559 [Tanacetum coccineum]